MSTQSAPTPEQSPQENRRNGRPAGQAGDSAALDRLLPQDVDAEMAVLGSMLVQKECVAEVLAALGDSGMECFTREKHQLLFRALVALYSADQPTDDHIVVESELSRRGLWDRLGKFEFLTTLINRVGSTYQVRRYAEIIRDKHLLRRLIDSAHRVLNFAMTDRMPAKEILDRAEKEMFAVTERRITTEAQQLPELVREAFRAIESRDANTLSGAPSGFIDFDDLTCGLQRSEFIVVAGRPSMGKTTFGMNMAEHLAIVERRPVLFFSLEMSRQQLAQRILCSRARVRADRLRRGQHTADDMDRLTAVAAQLGEAPLWVDDTSDLTILELRARTRLAHRRHKIAAVFVDYLQLMRSPGSESRQVEVASISHGLKALAKELEMPVVALAQLNRGPEDNKGRKGNKPRMSDLRESGAIEQDADVIALLHREAYYDPPSKDDPEYDKKMSHAELLVVKQRNGPTGDVKLHFNGQFNRFDNHLPHGDDVGFSPRGPEISPF